MRLVNLVETVGFLPVVYLRKFKTLALSDSHLGYESEMASKGIFIPKFQKRKLLKILKEAFDMVDVEKVVIAGDLKHKFDGLSFQEKIEIKEVLDFLKEKVSDIVIVKGNHDNYLSLITKRYGVEVVEEFKLDDILIIHGHKKPKDLKRVNTIIMGHEHPSIVLKERLGVITKLPCFLVGKLSISNYNINLIVLPAVGAYQTGSKVTLTPETYLSPILKEMVKLETLKPFVFDEEIGILEFPTLKEMEEALNYMG